MKKSTASYCGRVALFVLSLCGWMAANPAFAETFIVKDGKPCAEIIISEQPARMARLAAEELQTCIEKISGAKLAITNEASNQMPVKIYVGKNKYTDQLKITDNGLNHGAFKMVSGKPPPGFVQALRPGEQADSQAGWLVLLGHDSDFTPNEPYLRNHADMPRLMKEWDERTGEKWMNPVLSTYRHYSPAVGIWDYDERGSLNAVYEFLRSLGVRWYMPGELGEIIPKTTTLALPQVDKTIRPDFALRELGPYAPIIDSDPREAILWRLRLGLAPGKEIIGREDPAHGINNVHGRDEVKKAHPEYYAIYGNRRATDRGTAGSPCLSSPGLFEQNVKYARAIFDIYDEPAINVMPQDAYVYPCQCDLCKGKATPERGLDGMLSDYVWDYVNRVAIELMKTHPGKKVICFAYNTFLLPPEKIDKLSPNVVAGIAQNRTTFYDPETRRKAEALRQAWLKKMPSEKLLIYEYYLYSRGDNGLPIFFPHLIAQDLRSLKGISQGENIELTRTTWKRGVPNVPQGMHAPGFNHLNVYVTARLYWDADQDVDALLDEYYEKYYGPAAREMKAFIEFSEINWPKMSTDAAPIAKAMELLTAARKAAGDTVYGQRVDLLVDYCQKPLAELRDKLARGRNKDLKFYAAPRDKAGFKLDGKLDDKFWEGLTVYPLSNVKSVAATTNPPTPGITTTFRIAWGDDGAFYFGIRCDEPDIKGLNITSRKPDDTAVWEGDNIELMIETQVHSYYQIAIGPAGSIMDVDRKSFNTLWASGMEAATYVGDGFWSMELRMPVAGDLAETVDPLNGIAGRKPTEEYPWYFNLCRQRMRGIDREFSSSSPTESGSFHDLWSYGQLIVK